MRKLAQIVSNIFDPLLLIPIVFGLCLWQAAQLQPIPLVYYGVLGLSFVVVPAVAYFWMLKTGRINNPDISDRKLRLPLFYISLLSQASGLLLIFATGQHHLVYSLGRLWLLLLVFAGITRYSKVSIHVGVNMTLALLMIEHFDRWELLCLPLIVAVARIVDKQHTWPQVLMGMAVPLVIFGL